MTVWLRLDLNLALVPSQVLERRGWQGLDEVVRLLNCSELAFTGAWPSLPSEGGWNKGRARCTAQYEPVWSVKS